VVGYRFLLPLFLFKRAEIKGLFFPFWDGLQRDLGLTVYGTLPPQCGRFSTGALSCSLLFLTPHGRSFLVFSFIGIILDFFSPFPLPPPCRVFHRTPFFPSTGRGLPLVFVPRERLPFPSSGDLLPFFSHFRRPWPWTMGAGFSNAEAILHPLFFRPHFIAAGDPPLFLMFRFSLREPHSGRKTFAFFFPSSSPAPPLCFPFPFLPFRRDFLKKYNL